MPETSVYPKKAWTVLIFMAADNDLSEMAKFSQRKMKKLADDTQIHVVGQLHTRPIGGSGVERFRVAGEAIEKLGDPLPDLNTGDPATLRDFLIWGREHFPAERTALIIWGHGTGLDDLPPDFDYSGIRDAGDRARAKIELKRTLFSHTLVRLAQLNPVQVRGIAVDATARDYLDTEELKNALAAGLPQGVKLDMLGFDACLMGCIEIAYQLRDVAQIMVSSQDPVPGLSWPYEHILNSIARRPEMTGEELGAVIVEKYGAQIEYEQNPYSIAALELGQVAKTYAHTASLVATLEPLDMLHRTMVRDGLNAITPSDPTRPGARDVVDFHRWCAELRYQSRVAKDTPLYNALKTLEADLKPQGPLVRAYYSNPAANDKVHGVSTYWPRETYSAAYDTLSWSSSGWGRMLKRLSSKGSQSILSEVEDAAITVHAAPSTARIRIRSAQDAYLTTLKTASKRN